jgi:hypothetical protein
MIPPSNDDVPNIPVGVYLYSDKAKLGQFGSLKSYPVIGRLSFIPSEIRNGQGPGGARVLAWLPVACNSNLLSRGVAKLFVYQVNHSAGRRGVSESPEFKRAVYHYSMESVLKSLQPFIKCGMVIRCWDNVLRRFFPFVCNLVADYEEQFVI